MKQHLIAPLAALSLLSALPSGAWAGEDLHISEAPFGSFGRSVSARIFVNAPPVEVFRVLTDYDHLSDFMPLVDRTTLLDERSGRARVEFQGSFMGVIHLIEVDERQVDPARRIRWHAVQGPLKTSDGSWVFSPSASGTELRYETQVDPGVPLPPSLTGYLIKRGLPDLLNNVKRRAESGGTWHK